MFVLRASSLPLCLGLWLPLCRSEIQALELSWVWRDSQVKEQNHAYNRPLVPQATHLYTFNFIHSPAKEGGVIGPVLKPGSHLRDKHNTREISISATWAQEKRNKFLFLVLMLVLISPVLRLSHKWEPAYFTSIMLIPQVWTRLNFAANEWKSLREPSLYPVLNEAFPKQLVTYPIISNFVVFSLDIIVLFVLFTHLYCFKFTVSVVCSIVSANCFKVAQNSFQQLDFDGSI